MRVKTNKRKGNMRQKGEEKKERQIHILPLILECLSRRSCSGSCSAYYLCLLGFYLRSWSHSKWCRTPSYIWSQPMSPTFSSFWFHLFFAGVCTSNKLSVLRRRNVKKERKEKKKREKKRKKNLSASNFEFPLTEVTIYFSARFHCRISSNLANTLPASTNWSRICVRAHLWLAPFIN